MGNSKGNMNVDTGAHLTKNDSNLTETMALHRITIHLVF